MLEMRDVVLEVDLSLHQIIGRLVQLAGAHRDTLMIGRTHAQPALPTTFGYKVAGWTDELLRGAERRRPCATASSWRSSVAGWGRWPLSTVEAESFLKGSLLACRCMLHP